MEKFEGITVKLGGRDYIVPALNMRATRTLKAEIDLLGDADKTAADPWGEERMAAVAAITHAALARNYPELTLTEVEGSD